MAIVPHLRDGTIGTHRRKETADVYCLRQRMPRLRSICLRLGSDAMQAAANLDGAVHFAPIGGFVAEIRALSRKHRAAPNGKKSQQRHWPPAAAAPCASSFIAQIPNRLQKRIGPDCRKNAKSCPDQFAAVFWPKSCGTAAEAFSSACFKAS